MGARSLRRNQEKLQRARLFHYEVLSSSAVARPPAWPPISSNSLYTPIISDAYPPIFLPPSNFNSFSPSPSPVLVADQDNDVPTAAIVGGGVASVVALAATATIASTVAGRLGLTCLLGPVGKLLSFLFENFLGPACTAMSKSKDDTAQKGHRDRKRRKSNGAGGDDTSEGSTSEWETQSDESSRRASKEESSVAAAHSLTRSPRRDVEKSDEDGSKRRKLVHDKTTELRLVEEEASVSALHKQETKHTVGALTHIPISYGTMISMPTKEKQVVLSNEIMSPTKEKCQEDDVNSEIGNGKRKRKQQSSLGHVSLSCDIGAHYLRLFTACKLGGVYGSPMASPDHTVTNDYNRHHLHNANHHHDGSNIIVTYMNNGKPNNARYQTYVSMHNPSRNDFTHEQLYHPSKSILVQHNTKSVTPFATQHGASLHINPIQLNNTKVPSHNKSKSSAIDDYGSPFDGVL